MVRDTNALEVDEGTFGVGVLDKVSKGEGDRVIPLTPQGLGVGDSTGDKVDDMDAQIFVRVPLEHKVATEDKRGVCVASIGLAVKRAEAECAKVEAAETEKEGDAVNVAAT